jgi:hypothetical protein
MTNVERGERKKKKKKKLVFFVLFVGGLLLISTHWESRSEGDARAMDELLGTWTESSWS